MIVLERRYVPLGILSAQLKLIRAEKIQPRSNLVGEELIKLEYPLEVRTISRASRCKKIQAAERSFTSSQMTITTRYNARCFCSFG